MTSCFTSGKVVFAMFTTAVYGSTDFFMKQPLVLYPEFNKSATLGNKRFDLETGLIRINGKINSKVLPHAAHTVFSFESGLIQKSVYWTSNYLV